MTKPLQFLLFAVILITSCKEDESPKNYLDGTYENVGINSETGISYVSQYIFNSDGNYERISLLRQGGQLLGYNFYSKGTYTLRGEEFAVQNGQMAGLDYEDYPEGYAESLEELENYRIDPMDSKGSLRHIDSGEKIAILMECNDLIGFNSMCMGEQIYDKVD